MSVARSTSGVGQPVLGFNYGYKGAPAMDMQQFMCWQQKATFNAAFYVSPPLGTYDRNRLLNISTNRWEFKPELTAAYIHGKWWERSTATCSSSAITQSSGEPLLRAESAIRARRAPQLRPAAHGLGLVRHLPEMGRQDLRRWPDPEQEPERHDSGLHTQRQHNADRCDLPDVR